MPSDFGNIRIIQKFKTYIWNNILHPDTGGSHVIMRLKISTFRANIIIRSLMYASVFITNLKLFDIHALNCSWLSALQQSVTWQICNMCLK